VTARIHGSVYFTDASGAAAQAMQGVNVVARWINPATHQPSGAAVVTSVSGFSFVGNAGNVVTGYTDATGLNFDRFGSDDPTLEGFFDLAGLQIPNGATSAQYQLSVESPAPANTPSAFNTAFFGETRLDAQILQPTTFRLGIADYRGDGRPDYRYNARVFYGDNVAPARASVAGGTPLTIQGLGLQANTAVQAANVAAPVLAASATRLLVDAPAVADGVYDVQLSDAASGGTSVMTGVLTVGAGPGDIIKMISGTNPATPVGGQAQAPFAVMVTAADGVTPVSGASVQFSSSSAVAFSACAGAAMCTVLSDQSGMASTFMTVLSANVMTLTAKLAPASYANPQQVQATLLGVSSALDLSLTTPAIWVAQGATVSWPITVRVMANGSPAQQRTVNFQVNRGVGSLSSGNSGGGSSAAAVTDSQGYATVNLQLTSVAAAVQVSACVAPTNAPCQVLNATVVPTASLQLQAVAGTLQIAASGQTLQPVVIRVVDSSLPPNGVLGASVFFQDIVGRVPQNQPIIWTGEAGISQPGMPVILGQAQATVPSDGNGLAAFALSTGGVTGDVAVGGAGAEGASLGFVGEVLGP
jgi:IPT/TIG domain